MSEQRSITKAEKNVPERVSKRPVISPSVDIYENKDEILLVADVPGVDTDDFNINFDKDQLFIEATGQPENSELNPLFREFSSVDYRRIFELAPGIDVAKITADLDNGVLSIHLPKSEAVKPRKIPVS